MKKTLFTLCLWLTVSWLWAQRQADPNIFTGNAAFQEKPLDANGPGGPEIYIQVGAPIPYVYKEAPNGHSFNIRFPWDVAYIPLTFSEDHFEVSKGYFSDKVRVNWTVQSNGAQIDQIKVFRREFREDNQDDIDNYVLLATLSSDSYTYEDSDTQGGLLYEYKIEASGVSSIPKKYVTYVTGVGYRNPTGVVTGNVGFDGGSPVKDVVVRADPQGGDLAFGSSLLFTDISLLSIPLRNKELNEAMTLQAWVKVEEGSSASVFKLQNNPYTTDEIEISYKKGPGSFELGIAHTTEGAATFTVGDYYPTGNVDGRGMDTFNPFMDSENPQNSFSENFVHITIVLEKGKTPLFYLNGRNIHEDYPTSLPEEVTVKPTIATSGDYVFNGYETAEVTVAGGLAGNVDEVRLWNKILQEKQIRIDFKRYLGGSEPNLISYLRCDEKAGEYAYDISKIGVEFNKNHARVINGTWVNDKPTSSQLGILGVTDSLGNYVISAIPFSGTGESYTITPMFGVHQFQPGQQLVFIGNGSEVSNKIDFKDISAFDFLGRAYYTSNGVFAPADTVENAIFLGEAGYNQYHVIMDGREQRISKGEYFYDPVKEKLYESPKIYTAGANVYVDGNIVLDSNKRPVVTDEEGFFNIKVPIGEHYIEVRKDRHSFAHGGRFPAAREDENDLFDFFEHQQAAVTFLDTTRVSLVGRVVGGVREAEKPIGFGYAGRLQETYHPGTAEEKTVDISSVNNIGQATITLSYLPFGGTPEQALTTTFTTNNETGEYKADLIPLNYTIDQANGIRIASDPGFQMLEANETVNLSEMQDTVRSEFINRTGDTVYSSPYHFVKSFTYRSVPVLDVVSQSSDLEILVKQEDAAGNIQEVPISTEGFEYPVYRQGGWYAIMFETFEEYLNKDGGEGNEIVDQVPITDGQFNITNNLALADTESITVSEESPSMSKYTFQAGMPSISSPFTRTIDIRYRVGGKDYDARNYKTEGIILGGESDGSQTFVTKAPNYPDIILRDPPGSNSFASIEKGESLTFTEKGNVSIGQSAAYNIDLRLGTTFEAGGGLAGPVVKSEGVNDLNTGISLTVASNDGGSITKTYAFNQTISTSDNPLFVGSEGDLYIGNTKNYYYGSFDNIQADKNQLGGGPSLVLTNSDGESVHVSKQKGFYFSEEPTNTFFIYSQKHILETLIPELEGLIEGIELGNISEETPGVLPISEYREQVRLWKMVIQKNEQTKYASLYNRENYKSAIEANLENEIEIIKDHLNTIETLGAAGVALPAFTLIGVQTQVEANTMLNAKKANLEEKLELLRNGFLQNVSFDAGVGEYTNSSEITVAQQSTREIKLDLDASIEASMGFALNDFGLVIHTNNHLNTSVNSALTEESTGKTTVKYTLKDNDRSNFLSVDVVNIFDGNGPVFSTIGGRTSCPYEGIDYTHFYNHAAYSSDTSPLKSTTIYSGGERLNFATQRVEVPAISVEVASVTDVPEERAAEFKLILENNSAAEADVFFELYVDNTTNPHNAKFNLLPGGQVVFVPYGQKIEYALTLEKSISDVYEYKDINIVLGSLCDPLHEYATVTVSAVFRPSCTAVEIDSPLENWVFNAGNAYNPDNTTNPLNIAMFGYNRAFDNFESFRLEYRKSTSSTWTRLQTYYNTQELLDAAIVSGEDQGSLIAGNTTSFPWDIGALGLADGQYELRVVSNCSNGTEYVSKVVKGTVDLNVPVQFGTPTPTDGILGAGEDMRLRFSEPVLYSSALSKIEIKGETNQQEIDHNVSIYFEGAANTLMIEKPNILEGDFSIEFWMKTRAGVSGVLFEQENGLNVMVNNGNLIWTFGGETLSKAIAADDVFHHYTLTYSEANDRLSIYQDDQDLGALENAGIGQVKNDKPLIIGGNTFTGNLHDLRFWSKSLTLSEAYAAQFNELLGTERDLVGYWPMNEGHGTYARDLARFRHALIHAEWDIKPKGTAYDFQNGQYLILDDVGFVQLTDLMDVTLSFWMKTADQRKATLFSNGRGNGEDLVQSNGKANKWAVSIEGGILYLYSEGNRYTLSATNLADNSWHHVSIVLRRIGSLNTYIDAALESSNPMSGIGGLSGNKFWVGARGFVNSANVETVDEVFTGKIDELRLWNMARSTEQIDRDRFNEVDFNSMGLMLYARMNQPDPVTGNGPAYYRMAANETVLPGNAKLSSGAVSYTDDAPGIKPERPYLSFEVSHVINGDEIIVTPMVSDWSVLEGQILDITIDRMFDEYGNRQSSPITWSVYVRRNEMAWFVADGSQNLTIEKQADEPYSFEVTLLNKGGKKQPYAIGNIPFWMSAENTSGTLDPNSSKTIRFRIDPGLTIGEYSLDLYLDTDFNFDEKIFIDLRVLGKGPDWAMDPSGFEYNMSIIGKIRINGVFSRDKYSKVGAFVDNELRGVASLEYDQNFNEYFLYLTVYSDMVAGEVVSFKIWDAGRGEILHAAIDGEPAIAFIRNEITGNKSVPAIFENTGFIEQNLVLDKGWTWVSLYVETPDLADINALTATLRLADNDLIKSQHHFDVFDRTTGWAGSLSNAGGLTTLAMHKVKLANSNRLTVSGRKVDINQWKVAIHDGWNWFSYPLSNNVPINDILALLDAEEGDVIKNQTSFAIYDPIVGWSGTLGYLEAGDGYMLMSGKSQEFSYPRIFGARIESKTGNGNDDHGTNKQALSEAMDWRIYENNMNVIAEVVAEEDFDAVWVVDKEGTVRGKSDIITLHGRKISYITVFGNTDSPEELFFQLGNGGDRKTTAMRTGFIANAILGTMRDPIVLEVEKREVMVYPNPFKDDFYMSVDVESAQESMVTLINVLGQEIYSRSLPLDKGNNVLLITPPPTIAPGVYYVVIAIDGKRMAWKLVKI